MIFMEYVRIDPKGIGFREILFVQSAYCELVLLTIQMHFVQSNVFLQSER